MLAWTKAHGERSTSRRGRRELDQCIESPLADRRDGLVPGVLPHGELDVAFRGNRVGQRLMRSGHLDRAHTRGKSIRLALHEGHPGECDNLAVAGKQAGNPMIVHPNVKKEMDAAAERQDMKRVLASMIEVFDAFEKTHGYPVADAYTTWWRPSITEFLSS